MTNALTIYERMSELQTAANAMHASGMFADVKTQAQALVKIMAGAEMGLPPFASMSGIHIVQGKPVLGANLIATLVKNDPRYDYRIRTCDNNQCVLVWYENGATVGESGFTAAEAQAAGLAGKDNWKKYPSDMLFARAISRGARRYAPGIFGGAPVYTPDEFNLDTDEDGHIVNVTPAAELPAQPQPARNDNGKPADPQPAAGPMPEDEALINDIEPRDFIPAVASLIGHDADTVKAWFRANGVTSVPKTSADRVRAYKNIRDALKDAPADGFFDEGQPELVAVPTEAANGAYND